MEELTNMKKLLALAIICAMMFALAIPATASNIKLPDVPKADIVIDGERDEGYGDMFRVESYRDGNGDGATASIWMAWNESGIFYYAEVNDVTPNHNHSNTYERDNIEFFIDWNAAKPDGNDQFGPDASWQIRIPSAPNEDGNVSSGTLGDDELQPGTHYVVKPLVGGDLSGGYKMEVWLPIALAESGANPLAVGRTIFVDFQIADNQLDEGRSSQAFLDGMADGTDSQWNTPEAFQGVVTLAEAKPAPVADEPDEPAANDGGAGGDAGAGAAVVSTPSPRTNDAGIIALIALMAIAAAGIVVLKKRTN